MLRMTCHAVEAEGCRSGVSASWQEPPPWTALPWKLRVCGTPMARVLLEAAGAEA